MAELIDNKRMLDDEIKALESLEIQDEDDQQEPDSKPDTPDENEVPEKYKNKSLNDIVRMHQEAEKMLGRQANEVGDLRKVVDDFIVTQTKLATDKQEDTEEVDFFIDPRKAVNKSIEDHPAFAELRNLTFQQKQATAQAEMLRRHPDANKLVGDSKFQEWVGASKIRQSLLLKADREYDVDSADELFNLWKERQSLVQSTAATEKDARKDTVRKASSGNTANAHEPSSRKKFRRTDIIKLMRDDPDRYASLSAEIRQAYAEGRVV